MKQIETSQSAPGSVLADSSLVIGFQIVSLVVGLGALTVAARAVSQEDLGAFVLLSLAGAVLSLVFDFGLQDATVHFVASETQGQLRLVHSIAQFRIVVAVCVVLATAVVGSTLTWFGLRGFGFQTGLLAGACFLGEYLATFTNAALQGLRRFRLLGAFLLGDSFGRLAFAVVLLGVFRTGLPGLVAVMVVPRVIASLLVLLRLRLPVFVLPPDQRMREVLRFGLPLQVSAVVALVYDKAAIVMLASLMGPASVASYDLAAKLPDRARTVFGGFRQVFFPQMCVELARKKRTAGPSPLLNDSLRIIGFTASGFALAAVLFGPAIMKTLFSARYEDAGVVFGVLTAALAIGFCNHLLATSMVAAGQPRRALVVIVAQAGTVLGLNWILIPTHGAAGAAFATLGGNMVANALCVALVADLFGWHMVWSYGRSVAPLLVCCVTLSGLDYSASLGVALVLIAGFAGVGVVSGAVTRDDLVLLRKAINARFPRGKHGAPERAA